MMNIERKKIKDTTTLIFSGELTIYHVTRIKQDFLSESEKVTAKIALDLHQVTEIDTAGVQLLLFAKKLFSSLNKELFISKNNESVDMVLTALGVNSQFVR
jgi:anti-sigma B factor antagonist